MTRTLARALVATAVMGGAAMSLSAAVPTLWQVATEAEFLRGTVENLTVDRYGRVMLGPSVSTLYEGGAPFLWTMAPGPAGTTYVGTGNEGQVLSVSADGTSRVFFDSEELEVHALASGPQGVLYAGTSPDGRIYRVAPDGTASVFFDPPDRYIWSLAVNAAGVVFAATGDTGTVYRIGPDGTGEPFYATRATHAMALAFDAAGALLVGTASPGRVFRVDAAGRPFVLLDVPQHEIRTLRTGPAGVVYALAIRERAAGAGAPAAAPAQASTEQAGGQATVTVSTEVTVVGADAGGAGAQTTTAAPAAGAGTGAGAVYRIQADGGWDAIWQSTQDSPYDLLVEPDGGLLLATGNDGRIFRLAGDPLQATLVARAPAQQVTTLLGGAEGRTLFATSNPGKLFALSSGQAPTGTYLSDVRDAQAVAAWGTLRWNALTPADSRVEVSTRSGNTRTPDETWSPWSPAYAAADGSAIASPRARYLQWRAVLTAGGGGSPVLTSVGASYLPRNARPRVSAITIHPPGTVFQRPFPADPEIAGFDGLSAEQRLAAAQNQANTAQAGPALGRRMYQKGLMTFIWRAEDENGDELRYAVEYRREGETVWRAIRQDLAEPMLVWDTTSVPNGRYVLRVGASDAATNAPDLALTGYLESTAFEIDNAPPVVTVTAAQRTAERTTIAFDARDGDSSVLKAEFSLDGARWRTVYPLDGLADSGAERFELQLEQPVDPAAVVIRVTDTANNVTSVTGTPPPTGRR